MSPFFIPRYSRIDKIWGEFKHVVTFRWATGVPWPVFVGEKCVACQCMPNTRGCMKVKTFHGKGKNKRKVDHTSQVVNPVSSEQAGEGENTDNPDTTGPGVAANVSPTAEPVQAVPQNGSVQHEQQNGGSQASSREAHTSSEASIVALESGVSSLNIRLEHSPNQPYVVERTAENSAWTEGKGT